MGSAGVKPGVDSVGRGKFWDTAASHRPQPWVQGETSSFEVRNSNLP